MMQGLDVGAAEGSLTCLHRDVAASSLNSGDQPAARVLLRPQVMR